MRYRFACFHSKPPLFSRTVLENDAIFQRKALLERRRENLRAAMYFNDDDITEVDATQEEMDEERYAPALVAQ